MRAFRFAIAALSAATLAIRSGGSDASVTNTTTVTGTLNLPGGGGGSPALVASLGAGATTGGDGFTTSAINTTGANLIVVVKAWYGAVEPAITDSKSNSYTAAGAASVNATNWSVRQYYVYGGTVGTGHTFTLDGTENYASMSIMAFSGMATSPKDQDAGDEESAWTTLPSGSITPSQANTVSIPGVVFDDGSGTVTEPAGYTAGPEVMTSSGAHIGVSAAWKILTATTPINPDWTASTAYVAGASKHVNYKY